MRTPALGLILAIAMLAGAGVSASAGASATSACSGRFFVSPGTGSTLVSQIRVRNVSCAKATFAIGRYEHSITHSAPFTVAGRTFTCQRHTVAPRSNGVTLISCRHGGSQLVSWRSAYGI